MRITAIARFQDWGFCVTSSGVRETYTTADRLAGRPAFDLKLWCWFRGI